MREDVGAFLGGEGHFEIGDDVFYGVDAEDDVDCVTHGFDEVANDAGESLGVRKGCVFKVTGGVCGLACCGHIMVDIANGV